MQYKTIIRALALSGVILAPNITWADVSNNNERGDSFNNNQPVQVADVTEDVPANKDALELETKVKARLAEIVQEEKAEKKAANGYYVERKSYGTGRETEPPRYVKQLNKTWLKEYDTFADVDWIDIGLDYRFRYEYRDNDFRRGRDTIDEPILLRTRGFVAIKNILDPLRFTLEVEDARRNHSQFTREFDTRDVNYAEPIQAYAELYFKETPLGKDDLGNERPVSVRAGRHAFEYTDRRLLARNEWRNTTNNFQGVRTVIGQQKNDWQLDLLALKPVQRFTDQLDEVDHAQDFYGVIGDWRRWSEVVTLQPYYYLLKQDGNKVEYDANGKAAADNTKIDREIHTAGIRAYGVVGKTGWDYDVSYAKQWGNQDRLSNAGAFIAELDHDAYAYNAEVGYSFNHPWKPRLSAFYGVASGDKNPTDGKNNRFERLFGFARPWSNNDYFQMENLVAPKLRVEFEPQVSWLEGLKVDAGYNWYHLHEERDRWNSAGLRDNRGLSGKDIGDEVDVRVRFPIGKYVGVNLGYAHFWSGEFVEATTARAGAPTGGTNQADPDRRDHSNFFYTEISVSAF
ncbi:MAG: alginate export family protein [Methylophilales bacterium 16-45-9]|nr:MAG: alginate export family protein [Methylophilales bacterium 16-45-9]